MTLTQYRDIQNYFYTTVQRNMEGREQEEKTPKIISF